MNLVVIKVADENDDETISPQLKGLHLLTNSTARDTGVKHQLIAAIAENASETYENVRVLMTIIPAKDVLFRILSELKMVSIICESQSHSSKYPCCWCDVDPENLSKCGTSKSFGSMKENLKHLLLLDQIQSLQKILTM